MKALHKLLCLVLSFALAASVLFDTFAVTGAASYPSEVPIIYIHGEGSAIGTYDENGEFHRIDDMTVNGDEITSLLKDNSDILLKASVTQDWSEFCDLIAGYMIDSFGELALGKDGMPTDGSVSEVIYSETRVSQQYSNDDYSLDKYAFDYDWRLDPTDNMKRLHDYVETILKVTGSDKYAVAGRCEGACLAATYWETYHDPRITDLILYASAAKGVIPIGESFSGNMYVDPECVERYVYNADLNLNIPITDYITLTDQTLNSFLKIASDVYGLDYACWSVNNVYQQIYDTITPKVLKQTFGTFPGFWAMCEDRYFEQAKDVIFGDEKEDYSGLISKIDNYHYNIMNRIEEILLNAEKSGVDVSNVVKYGFQSYPLSKDSMVLSDEMCRVDYAGLGTTCTNIDEKFSEDYVNEAFKKGNMRYISPDLTIDASTTPFKDTTWYIKNLHHQNFTRAVECIFFEIVNTKGMTVRTNNAYPQFLFFDAEKEELLALNAVEHKTDSDIYNEEMEKDFFRFIKPVFTFLFRIITFVIKALMLPARA